MVKIDNLNNQSTNTNQTSADQPTSTLTKKEDSGIIKTIGQLLPLAPFVFEQFTGQKVPQMSGTVAEISLSLQQIQLSLQTLTNHQQTLGQKITNLETKLLEIQTSANNHLTNLTHQFNSLRLTHSRE